MMRDEEMWDCDEVTYAYICAGDSYDNFVGYANASGQSHVCDDNDNDEILKNMGCDDDLPWRVDANMMENERNMGLIVSVVSIDIDDIIVKDVTDTLYD